MNAINEVKSLTAKKRHDFNLSGTIPDGTLEQGVFIGWAV